jgi:hypothetical protein
VKDTAIKVEYVLNGRMTLYDTIASLTVGGTSVTVTLAHNAFPAGAVITAVSFSTGTIYRYDLAPRIPDNPLSAPLKQNLAVGCVPRYATFLGKLLICNGVDRVLCWDGTTLQEVYDFVPEETVALTRINDRHFSIVTSPSFDIANYAVGNLLQITVNGYDPSGGRRAGFKLPGINGYDHDEPARLRQGQGADHLGRRTPFIKPGHQSLISCSSPMTACGR